MVSGCLCPVTVCDRWLPVSDGFLCSVASCARWLPVLGDICILSLLFQCLEMLFREHIHPVFAFLKHKDYYFQPNSSLQTKSPRQGCIVPAFFILADRISSAGMHRPGIFHPYRQNLLSRDAPSPQLCPKLAGRTLIKPAVPIFKLPAFIPDDLFPVSRGTSRIQFRMTNSVSA